MLLLPLRHTGRDGSRPADSSVAAMIPAAGRRQSRVGRTLHGVVLFVCGDLELARWTLLRSDGLDLAVVDELARWQLAARRMGCSVQLRSPSPELRGLIDLAGLSGVLPVVPGVDCGGSVEVEREPEDREEGGRVEEVVMPDDPVA